MEHLRIKIYGKVQEVFFREFVKQKAEELNVTGFVLNDPDSTVFIEAEGKRDDLEKFLRLCHKGPESAKVENIEYQSSKNLKNFTDFRIVFEYPTNR